jgi:hypothetical protein
MEDADSNESDCACKKTTCGCTKPAERSCVCQRGRECSGDGGCGSGRDGGCAPRNAR